MSAQTSGEAAAALTRHVGLAQCSPVLKDVPWDHEVCSCFPQMTLGRDDGQFVASREDGAGKLGTSSRRDLGCATGCYGNDTDFGLAETNWLGHIVLVFGQKVGVSPVVSCGMVSCLDPAAVSTVVRLGIDGTTEKDMRLFCWNGRE
jgi:hypothetical protein